MKCSRVFLNPDTTIKKQIHAISNAGYILFHLFRIHGTNLIPSQTYHDLQSTFIDAIFCCAKMKIHAPSKALYLVLTGTDSLERFFGNVRLSCKTGLDALEFINCAMAACGEILSNHSDWEKKSDTDFTAAWRYQKGHC